MGCESNGSILLCISPCRLGKSWCVQPQVNGIPSSRRLVIVSARSSACGANNSTWSDIFIESTLMRYGHSNGGLIGITLNDKAIALLAHSLHSYSLLVRNLTSVQNELSKNPMHGSRLTTLTEESCGKGNTGALTYLTHLVIMPLCSALYLER